MDSKLIVVRWGIILGVRLCMGYGGCSLVEWSLQRSTPEEGGTKHYFCSSDLLPIFMFQIKPLPGRPGPPPLVAYSTDEKQWIDWSSEQYPTSAAAVPL